MDAQVQTTGVRAGVCNRDRTVSPVSASRAALVSR
jgi:hypothetical protein